MFRSWFGPTAEALATALRAASAESVPEVLSRGGRTAQLDALLEVLDEEAHQDRLELLQALAGRHSDHGVAWIEYWWEHERLDLVEGMAKAVVRTHPRHVVAGEWLVRAWIAQGKHRAAERFLDRAPPQEPVFHLLRAELRLEQEAVEEALEILEVICSQADEVLQSAMVDPGQHWRNVAVRAHNLRDAVLRDTQGDEAVLRAQAAAGQLMPHSGINHTLVGYAAMGDADRIAEHTGLMHPDEAQRWARQRLLQHPGDPLAQARLGEALLREGDLTRAERVFQELVHADASFFPGQLGLGATLLLRETRSLARVARLPSAALDDRWHSVFPDWHALLPAEQAVVAFSAAPLTRACDGLLRAGATVRLLPLDVRPTDLEDFAQWDDVRADDGRRLAGIGGMASTSGVAVARIEGLLAVGHSLVFAHELAHLAFWALPPDEQAAFEELFEAASEVPWAWTEYQRSNIDEFFAVSYETMLSERLGVQQLPPDPTGWWRRVTQRIEQA